MNRHYSWLANRSKRQRLATLRQILNQPEPPRPEPESAAAFLLRVRGIDISRCPHCGEQCLRIIALDTPCHPPRSPP